MAGLSFVFIITKVLFESCAFISKLQIFLMVFPFNIYVVIKFLLLYYKIELQFLALVICLSFYSVFMFQVEELLLPLFVM